ncbi:hypothetical protein M4D81_03630 [Paenibacillus sp. p3-SID867]|uniref:hypothetical protein n=1 Tax=Paenibacillus sp. p3-SID867 TaxID=2916363 RepID=UPI0021A6193E|nr:hypothetical protein [Paenibacillus sp. p3-SID867]MCT1398090.1 hypothetical protein [Paenibacillus sp. p3-SID867]
MQTTFQVDLDNEREVENLRQLLELRLEQLRSERGESLNGQGGIGESANRANENFNNIQILQKFVSEASPNQHEVLKWMKEHPGEVSAHVLKRDLPFLAPQGALPGVFRPGRWQRLSGGTKDGFPFLQIAWNHVEGCGIYRGLTVEEAEILDL